MALNAHEKEIGRRLRNMRESRNLNRKAVEDQTEGEIAEFVLELYEEGKRRIPSSRLEKLADFYGATHTFLSGENSRINSGIQDREMEVALMTDPRYSKEEQELLVHVINIIEAKRRVEGRLVLTV